MKLLTVAGKRGWNC